MTTEAPKSTRKKKLEKPAEQEHLDFEQSLDELSSLVEAMESGKLSLEDSLIKFEKGIQLTQHCQTALRNAEQRVNLLLEKNGQPILEPFNNNQDS